MTGAFAIPPVPISRRAPKIFQRRRPSVETQDVEPRAFESTSTRISVGDCVYGALMAGEVRVLHCPGRTRKEIDACACGPRLNAPAAIVPNRSQSFDLYERVPIRGSTHKLRSDFPISPRQGKAPPRSHADGRKRTQHVGPGACRRMAEQQPIHAIEETIDI